MLRVVAGTTLVIGLSYIWFTVCKQSNLEDKSTQTEKENDGYEEQKDNKKLGLIEDTQDTDLILIEEKPYDETEKYLLTNAYHTLSLAIESDFDTNVRTSGMQLC